jgi:phenylpropionate dioxygenase-like ring-hydroxylating dioxygenase large terminal subunit
MQPEKRNDVLTPPPAGEGGYDVCWYPVALSSEVPAGTVHSAEFLDGRVVVVRAEDGRVSVLSAYCRHVGADLADGDVVDGCVRCPFHHWRYGLDGECVGTAVGDRVPSGTALFAFPTQEKWGLIWAFNGAEPTYDVPSWDEDESERLCIAEVAADFRGDPLMVPVNVLDMQHQRSLHGLEVHDFDIALNDDGNTFDVEMMFSGGPFNVPRITRHAKLIGTNTVVYSQAPIGIDTISTAVPYGGRTRMYVVTGGLRSVLDADTIEAQVAERHKLSLDIIQQDLPVLQHLRYRADTMTKSDRPVATYLQFASKYPRAHPSAAFIN